MTDEGRQDSWSGIHLVKTSHTHGDLSIIRVRITVNSRSFDYVPTGSFTWYIIWDDTSTGVLISYSPTYTVTCNLSCQSISESSAHSIARSEHRRTAKPA